ncbi:MAG TPA: bifunctional 4-hydroxy-2-oxoglutarate aldolase/2-dehydro-3-deoxy-phosphogluconate aldolase [Opitutales bacterium]|nr:bifunctional 4-hydroxy-2-oxoglutarate aldolase/2-dehydro-3-deoxy-phosphogluconate aldolase [Opitutales bacterium]
MDTIELLARQPILPVIVIDDADSAVPLAEALMAGGLASIEITFRTKAAAEAIRRIRAAVPEMLVGAGTLLNAENADAALEAGAQFGLAPGLSAEVVAAFEDAGKLFIPGIMTPTEINQAADMGCKYLKFFPAETAGGAANLKAMNAAFKHLGLKYCPTGGITLANMEKYLSLPEVFAIGGSWLATRDQIAAGDWKTVSEQARAALTQAAKIRQS